MKLEDVLKEMKCNVDAQKNWKPYLSMWSSWYEGKVASFHRYKLYSGPNSWKWRDKKSLQMAKKSCEDWADILFNDKVIISVDNESSNKALQDILNKLDFWVLINQSIEMSGSTGTGAIVCAAKGIEFELNEQGEVIDVNYKDSEIKIDYVPAMNIYPISWKGQVVTECAFLSETIEKGKKLVYVTAHTFNDQGNYQIENRVFERLNNDLKEIVASDTLDTFDTESNIPWFVFVRPAGVNNIAPDSPWGLPYYAQAVDIMKSIDNAYDGLDNEIRLGKKRIFVSGKFLSYDASTGNLKFDADDIPIYVMPDDMDPEKNMLKSDSTDLRVDSYVKDINFNLKLYSEKCGLGDNFYRFDETGMKTAKEVASNNSVLFRRKKKHEISLESSLYDLIKAICYISGKFSSMPVSYKDITIKFDDSIFVDEESAAENDRKDLNAGTLARYEARMRSRGETEEVAKQKIEEIDKENDNAIG